MKPSDHTLTAVVSYDPVVVSVESTVVTEYIPDPHEETAYQLEAVLEAEFIRALQSQAYEHLPIRSEVDLIGNPRIQLGLLNGFRLSDAEWDRFFTTCTVGKNDGITEKTAHIHEDNVQLLRRDDGTIKNVPLIDQRRIHNNRLQVISQYEIGRGEGGARYSNQYDMTILTNGLPLVHIELKRRGVDVREAFNQTDRYQRNSFWVGSGLLDYVQLFVISNGTLTKYYLNTTRSQHLRKEQQANRGRKTSNSSEFTSWRADTKNRSICDLIVFAKTFFARHTLPNILTRYCVLTIDRMLLVMRPYQIVAAKKMLQCIEIVINYKKLGTIDVGGYAWHTTGSGKTLASFKTIQFTTQMGSVDRVLFVVDRKDLDYQTMRGYDRFQKGAANSNTSTTVLKCQLESRDARIIITTIQKLSTFIKVNLSHDVYRQHVVIIFDECHRSQLGDMRTTITKVFKWYNLFGFMGTPIFAINVAGGGNPRLKTTEQAFGEKLHTYTIVDAITDENVLSFRIDYVSTVQVGSVADKQVSVINAERALFDPKRTGKTVSYVPEHFDQKTKRASSYDHSVVINVVESDRTSRRVDTFRGRRRVCGFNALFATTSTEAARIYYSHSALLQENLPSGHRLKIGLIYSYGVNEVVNGGITDDEVFDTDELPVDARSFLEDAIQDYSDLSGISYDTNAERFQNHYRDLSQRIKNREIDLVIVVNMFPTGFDATTLNTLFADKNLRAHGLIQAYPRINRALNSVKTYDNIAALRNLEDEVNAVLELFGNREARGVVPLKPYQDCYREYAEKIAELLETFPPGQPIIGEAVQKAFIVLFGAILRLQNILSSSDDSAGNEILSERQGQDYRSIYLGLYAQFRRGQDAEKEVINDDILFEVEPIKQVEINIGYVLTLVQRYRDEHGDGDDKEIRSEITRAINTSPTLRNKRDLIETFVDSVSVDGHIDDEWMVFIEAERKTEFTRIIADKNLRPEAVRELVQNAFRNGELRITGVAITKILPPILCFVPSSGHDEKKRRMIARLSASFDRSLGLGAAPTEGPGHHD